MVLEKFIHFENIYYYYPITYTRINSQCVQDLNIKDKLQQYKNITSMQKNLPTFHMKHEKP